MPPAVRDLQQLIQQQNDALKPQYDLIGSDINAAESAGQEQAKGLDVAKNSAFGQIEQGAQRKGMFFSGVAPTEQAGYLGATYLPALAQLQQTIAQTRSGLLGKKAELGKGAFDTAVGLQQKDIDALNDWNAKTREQQFAASEAEKSRVFEAQQNQLKIAASGGGGGSANSSGNRAASKQADMGIIAQNLQSKVGKDGHVSQETWNRAVADWTGAGYSAKDFVNNNLRFVNQRYKGYHGYN